MGREDARRPHCLPSQHLCVARARVARGVCVCGCGSSRRRQAAAAGGGRVALYRRLAWRDTVGGPSSFIEHAALLLSLSLRAHTRAAPAPVCCGCLAGRVGVVVCVCVCGAWRRVAVAPFSRLALFAPFCLPAVACRLLLRALPRAARSSSSSFLEQQVLPHYQRAPRVPQVPRACTLCVRRRHAHFQPFLEGASQSSVGVTRGAASKRQGAPRSPQRCGSA